MSFILVADIGGTNARFGLVEIAGACATPPDFTAKHQHSLRCADYPSLDQMVHAYAEVAGVALPDFACFAIAGPIHNGRVRMTNLDWEFGIDELRVGHARQFLKGAVTQPDARPGRHQRLCRPCLCHPPPQR